MGQYHHLTLEEREDIMTLRAQGKGVNEIARETGRDKATVSRELSRNSYRNGGGRAYRASTAQRKYEGRRLSCRRGRLLDDPELAALVTGKIREGRWSPEQVAGRIALETGRRAVSRSTIYRAIDSRRLDPPDLAGTARGMRGELRHRGKRRHRSGEEERRGKIPGTRPISERPAEASARSRLGDWEGDTVVGKGGGACLVTLVDRRSGYLEGGRAAAHTKDEVAKVEKESLLRHPESNTVTVDRGKEFASFADVESEVPGVLFYFAQPHSPWQKGTNENTNGLLREYFPKGTDFGPVGEEEVAEVYDALNTRPRKRLGFRTPFEVHYSQVLHLL